MDGFQEKACKPEACTTCHLILIIKLWYGVASEWCHGSVQDQSTLVFCWINSFLMYCLTINCHWGLKIQHFKFLDKKNHFQKNPLPKLRFINTMYRIYNRIKIKHWGNKCFWKMNQNKTCYIWSPSFLRISTELFIRWNWSMISCSRTISLNFFQTFKCSGKGL